MNDSKLPAAWRRIHDGHYTNGVFTVRKLLTQTADSTFFSYKFWLQHAGVDGDAISIHDTLDGALQAAASAKPRFGR